MVARTPLIVTLCFPIRVSSVFPVGKTVGVACRRITLVLNRPEACCTLFTLALRIDFGGSGVQDSEKIVLHFLALW